MLFEEKNTANIEKFSLLDKYRSDVDSNLKTIFNDYKESFEKQRTCDGLVSAHDGLVFFY